jgi:hypothetical protein
MTYPLGSILLVRNYRLPTTVKDKFFIVIGENGNEFNLLSMTTSKIYFDGALIRHGVIKDRELSVYCFERGRVVGKKGFCFHKNTIVSHRSNIHIFTIEKIAALNIEVMDILLKPELENLIYSFYQSNIPNKYKKLFEDILNKICT